MLVTQSGGSLVRDLFQGSMRTRHTSTNNLYICVPPAKKCDKPATFKSIKNMFLHKREELFEFERKIMKEADRRTRFHPETDWFVDLVCWNTLERNLQEVDPLAQVLALVAQLKWDQDFVLSENRIEDEEVPLPGGGSEADADERLRQHVTLEKVFNETSEAMWAYKSAPAERKEELKLAWERCEATEKSYEALRKLKTSHKNTERDSFLADIHRFMKFFPFDFQSNLTFKEFEPWSAQLGKMFRVIKATTILQDGTLVLPLYLKDLGELGGIESYFENRKRYAEMVEADIAFIDHQNKLCQKLGLAHCLDFETETSKNHIEANRPAVEQALIEISHLTACKVAVNPRELSKMGYKAFMGKINSELSTFGQLRLETKTSGRSRRGGVHTSNSSYILAWGTLSKLTLDYFIKNKRVS